MKVLSFAGVGKEWSRIQLNTGWCLIFLFICTTVTGQSSESPDREAHFTNPVWQGADPWMTKHHNEYFYCFSADQSIQVSRSSQMTGLGEVRTIWEAPDSGWNSSCVWAPEIHFIQGHWYVYYAAGESGPPFVHQRAGVLRSRTSDAFGAYEDMGMLYTGDDPGETENNVWAIDMTVFDYEDRLYAVWSGWKKQRDTDKTSQHLYIQEMENPYTLKGRRVLISSPVEKWETGGPLDLNEGPQILKKDDRVFIIYSCRESWLPEYRLGMLYLKPGNTDLLNPESWLKRGPVFQGTDDVHGTGHASFVKSPDGREDWIIYHSKKGVKPGWDRDVRMQPFSWTEEGFPDFGKPIPAGVELKRPGGE